MEGLEQVALYGSSIHVVAQNAARQQPLIEAALRQADVEVTSVTVIPPSLEDVFIARAQN
jgi:hypothetical protein